MTPVTSPELLHWPDRRRRAEKQQWRQLFDLLEQAVGRARVAIGRGRPHSAIATPLEGLAEFLGVRTGLNFSAIDHATASGTATRIESQHLVVVTHPEMLRISQRMDLLRRCIRATRPAGQLLVAANVVGESQPQQDGTRMAIPSCSALLEQLEVASGQGLAFEDIRSVRWGHEPIHRGVILTVTRISTPDRW